jgi:6-phosphogluconolactonase
MMLHTMLRLTLCGLFLGVALATAAGAADDKPGKLRVYIGTYTGKNSKGIYLGELDLASGALTVKGLAGEASNPSFLAIHPSQKFLYAVSEIDNFEKKKTGGVSAFAIDPKTGNLTLLNQQPSGGAAPCHLVVDKAGKNVLVANYTGGSVASLPIGEDGKLKEPASVIQHKGSSTDPSRQKEPHAHSINLDAANKFAIAADLGLDKLLVYKFDPDKGTLTPNEPPSAAVAGGSGPRHFTFSPSGKYGYVINEMGNSVTAFSYDADKGTFKEIQTITTLPKDFTKNSTAEVVAHPSGKFLYGSNRGHDSIAIFAIDPDTGKLTAQGQEPTKGKTPRNFAIDPTGAYLLAENQDSGTIVVFRIDPKNGALKQVGEPVSVPAPVCVRFAEMPR